MLDEWSTQCGRRVRVCAVLAMHVPKPGIHTLWHFSCVPLQFPSFSTGQKESACSFLLSP